MTHPHEVAENERIEQEHHHAERVREEERRGVARLEAFSDGVFAIAITLLVLNLDAPSPDTEGAALIAEIRRQLPQFGGFALSFFVIGRFWVVHHSMFAYIRRYDPTFLTLNLVLLFLVAFLPFPTEIMGEHSDPIAVVLYAGTIALLSTASFAMWTYACRGRRLVGRDLDARFIRLVQLRSGATGAVFLASIPAAFLEPWISVAMWIAVLPLARVALQRRAQRHGTDGGTTSADAAGDAPPASRD